MDMYQIRTLWFLAFHGDSNEKRKGLEIERTLAGNAESQDDNKSKDGGADESSDGNEGDSDQISYDEHPAENADFSDLEDPDELSEENEDERNLSAEDTYEDQTNVTDQGLPSSISLIDLNRQYLQIKSCYSFLTDNVFRNESLLIILA